MLSGVKLSHKNGADCIWCGDKNTHFYKWLEMEHREYKNKKNKKVTKLYWPSRKRSPKRLSVAEEPKTWTIFYNKNKSGTFAAVG